MEKQPDRKIKMLQFDNIKEYKRDQFLRFGSSDDIDMHFTVWKQIWVVKVMNLALLEKVRCLLSNAQLDKSFLC